MYIHISRWLSITFPSLTVACSPNGFVKGFNVYHIISTWFVGIPKVAVGRGGPQNVYSRTNNFFRLCYPILNNNPGSELLDMWFHIYNIICSIYININTLCIHVDIYTCKIYVYLVDISCFCFKKHVDLPICWWFIPPILMVSWSASEAQNPERAQDKGVVVDISWHRRRAEKWDFIMGKMVIQWW